MASTQTVLQHDRCKRMRYQSGQLTLTLGPGTPLCHSTLLGTLPFQSLRQQQQQHPPPHHPIVALVTGAACLALWVAGVAGTPRTDRSTCPCPHTPSAAAATPGATHLAAHHRHHHVRVHAHGHAHPGLRAVDVPAAQQVHAQEAGVVRRRPRLSRWEDTSLVVYCGCGWLVHSACSQYPSSRARLPPPPRRWGCLTTAWAPPSSRAWCWSRCWPCSPWRCTTSFSEHCPLAAGWSLWSGGRALACRAC